MLHIERGQGSIYTEGTSVPEACLGPPPQRRAAWGDSWSRPGPRPSLPACFLSLLTEPSAQREGSHSRQS